MEENFKEALSFMGLPSFVTYQEIKDRYKQLAKKYHPDKNSFDDKNMQKLNQYYHLLKTYIENYRFSFSKEEISKQYLGNDYVEQYKF